MNDRSCRVETSVDLAGEGRQRPRLSQTGQNVHVTRINGAPSMHTVVSITSDPSGGDVHQEEAVNKADPPSFVTDVRERQHAAAESDRILEQRASSTPRNLIRF